MTRRADLIAIIGAAIIWGTRTPAAAQRFGAVAVHGDAIAKPTVLTADSIPICLWRFTYNMYSKLQAVAPFPLSKQVTLSFLTFEEWAHLNARSSDISVSDVAGIAQFHTRLWLAPEGQRPHVEFQKFGAGFVGRMQLQRIFESYFVALEIPTTVNAAGLPQLAQFKPAELDSIRNVLRQRDYAHFVEAACGKF